MADYEFKDISGKPLTLHQSYQLPRQPTVYQVTSVEPDHFSLISEEGEPRVFVKLQGERFASLLEPVSKAHLLNRADILQQQSQRVLEFRKKQPSLEARAQTPPKCTPTNEAKAEQ